MDDEQRMPPPDIQLPPPGGAAAARGAALFQRILAAERKKEATSSKATQQSTASAFSDPQYQEFGGRQYPVAFSKVRGASEDQTDPAYAALPPLALAQQQHEHTHAETTEANPEGKECALPLYPPAFAPMVRPAVQRKAHEPATLDTDALETVADEVMFISDPDGSTSFDITFNDATFDNLRCRLRMHEGKAQATFFVDSIDTRRLLEAEAGQLRARLEERGIKVQGVSVVMEAAQNDPPPDP